MWPVVCSLLFLFVSVTNGQVGHFDIDDFAETDGDYEFVFHDDHDLFLVLVGDDCYFFPVERGQEWSALNPHERTSTEDFVRALIETNSTGEVRPSDLDQMTDVFGDVLANFRCAGSNIYFMEFDVESTHEPLRDHDGFHPRAFFHHDSHHRHH